MISLAVRFRRGGFPMTLKPLLSLLGRLFGTLPLALSLEEGLSGSSGHADSRVPSPMDPSED